MKVYYNGIEIGKYLNGTISIKKEFITNWKPELADVNLDELSEDDFTISIPNTMYISTETSFDLETDSYVTIHKIKDRPNNN